MTDIMVPGMHLREDGLCTLPFFDGLPWLQAGITTRAGGVSEGFFSSMNMSFTRGDDPARVTENYRLLADRCAVDMGHVAYSRQVHGTACLQVAAGEGLTGLLGDAAPQADGLLTDEPGLLLTKTVADCVPLYLADPEHRAVALLHAGWRGMAGGIVGRGVAAMAQAFSSRPQALWAAVGPSIGPCCFEVGEEVAAAFDAWPGVVARRSGAKPFVDLWRCVRLQLIHAGLTPERIGPDPACTSCREDLFFSHRRQQGRCGVMAAYMMILPD